jgi:hypothetical protein
MTQDIEQLLANQQMQERAISSLITNIWTQIYSIKVANHEGELKPEDCSKYFETAMNAASITPQLLGLTK